MLTGLNNNESIDLAYEAGATDFTMKPISWTLLTYRIRYMIRAWTAAEDLVKNQRDLASAQRIAQLGNWQLDLGSGEMEWSDQMFMILGCNKSDVAPSLESLLGYVHEADKERVQNWFALNQQQTALGETIDYRLNTACGHERHVRQQCELINNKEGELVQVVAVVQDFTERRRAESRIEQLAYYDEVTNLANRAFFTEKVDEAISQAERYDSSLAVLYIDLDDFKQVNDTLGHSAGDVMLKEIASRISGCLRSKPSESHSDPNSKDTVVARMGADEFTIMLTNIDHPNEATAVAARVLQTLSQPYALNGGEVFSSSSIGIAIFPGHGATGEAIIKNADMAMSDAKRRGKKQFKLHDGEMNAEAQNRFRIESLMRPALEREEFSVHYQPQIDLDTGNVYAAEALVRWNSAELGFVSPGEFIHIAEENGFIVPLGEWVLRSSCKQAKLWNDSGFPIQSVAVNISVLQFMLPDFPDTVARILTETGLEPNHLELEITESLLATDTEGAVHTLQKLKTIGVQLSIDDFGTGYSSLSQLKNFPIDRLKIDQSFIQGITSSKQDAAIVRAVIAMAESLEIRFLAEGVETVEQLDFLKAHDCNEIQGYYISRPMASVALDGEMPTIVQNLGVLFDENGERKKAA